MGKHKTRGKVPEYRSRLNRRESMAITATAMAQVLLRHKQSNKPQPDDAAPDGDEDTIVRGNYG